VTISVSLYAKDINELNTNLSISNEFVGTNNSELSLAVTHFKSPHDLSKSDLQSNDESGDCIVCHAQNGKKETDILWGKSIESPYLKPGMDHIMLASTTSLKCLGCHDGATAANNLPNGTAGYSNVSANMNSNLYNNIGYNNANVSYQSQDLGNNHPVGIIYDESNPELNAIADLKIAKLEAGTNKVTCASCHEPHGSNNGSFLMISNVGSSLCLDCHNK